MSVPLPSECLPLMRPRSSIATRLWLWYEGLSCNSTTTRPYYYSYYLRSSISTLTHPIQPPSSVPSREHYYCAACSLSYPSDPFCCFSTKPSVMTQIERITENLQKPELDDRSYRVIRLPNQLEALLVHDPDTDKASAAVNVNVGNFSDEDDMPGMAHAVEHLLFMGTKKVRFFVADYRPGPRLAVQLT